MGNMPVHQGPDRRHGRGPLEEGPARHAVADRQAAGARARVHRAAREHGRRHAVDGLHPVRRLRVGLPGDGGRPAASSARPRWPRPTASSATRATTSSSSASTTSPRTRRASSTARTASSASRPAPRTSTRWARSCACAASRRQRPPHRRPQQRRAPRGGVHDADQGQRPAVGGRAAAALLRRQLVVRQIRAAPPAKSCSARCRRSSRRCCAARSRRWARSNRTRSPRTT